MIELEIKGGIIPTDKPVSVEDIIELSKCQHATCMYSEKELRGFSQEKLNVIFQGIQALSGRGPWRRTRSLREFLGK